MANRDLLMPALPGETDTKRTAGRWTVTEVLRLKAEALLVRHAAAAHLTILEARRRLAEAGVLTEEAEVELHLRRAVRTAPVEHSRQMIGQEIEVERLLLEREQLRQPRRTGAVAGLPPLPPDLRAAVEWEIDDQQVEAMAVKAVTRFSQLAPLEAERAWAAWKRELGLRLPPYAAAEVARRAEQLRGLLR